MANIVENNVVAAIMLAQEQGEPVKVYRKAIVGRVVVRVIDPFSGERAEVLISGVPGKADPSELEISLWTPFEVKYFEQFNKGLIESGSIVPVEHRAEFKVNLSNALSDDQLKEVLVGPFFSLRKVIAEITSETTMQRALQLAKELNRPAKTVQEIELRLEEIQQNS
jgi:hypothetical protein